MNINGISYSSLINTVVANYLTNTIYTKETGRYIYEFVCRNPRDNYYFARLITHYSCWLKVSKYHYTWSTKSTALDKLRFSSNESAEDILNVAATQTGRFASASDHIQDADRFSCYVEEYVAANTNTNTNISKIKVKENIMSNDRVESSFSVDIKVSGSSYKLTDEFTAEYALPVVLKLSNRVKLLKERIELVCEAKNAKTDMTKVTDAFESEISDIHELLDYINSNVVED